MSNPYLPKAAAKGLAAHLLTGEPKAGVSIELVITLDDRDLNLRDLSKYFQLIDRAYGRLVVGDLKKYAWKRRSQLKVARIEKGSWELVLAEAVSKLGDHTGILLTYLLVKYLPHAAERSAAALSHLATAYNSLEQGKLARANRRQLRKQIQADSALQGLPDIEQRQLAEVLDQLIRETPGISKGAQRLSEESVMSVRIRRIDGTELD